MLEYVVYALLGVLTIGCLLYVTMSPRPKTLQSRQTPSNSLDTPPSAPRERVTATTR